MTAAVGHSYWFFTAPHDPVPIRRGDPLGLRLAADHFADLLVPDLSNRSVDARWLTLLSWSLVNANQGWRHYVSRDLSVMPGEGRDAGRKLYDWVRPLELLWVARTLHLAGSDSGGRQLPGQRAVKRWLADDGGKSDEPFSMSPAQWSRYRQTGAYGGYRVAFRRLPGLTVGGDGWTPGPIASRLADIADAAIAWRKPRFPEVKRREVDPVRFWLGHWQDWSAGADVEFVPQRSDDVVRLPAAEAREIRSALFGLDGVEPTTRLGPRSRQARRSQVVERLAATRATTHADLCHELADELTQFDDDARRRLAVLPRLSRLADAGVQAMDKAWDALGEAPRVSVRDLVQDVQLANALDELRREATAYGTSLTEHVSGTEVADRLARTVRQAPTAAAQLTALVEHHQHWGGGMRWFVLSDGSVTRNAPANRGGRASRYRFRLWGLARLAVQCGVLPAMPTALLEADDTAAGGEEQ